MTTFGICTIKRDVVHLSYEKQMIYRAAQQSYDQVWLVDPRRVAYILLHGAAQPVAWLDRTDLASLSSLFVGTTQGHEIATTLLAHTLRLCGCDVLDPLERFSIGRASKVLTTLHRFQQGIAPGTMIAFEQVAAQRLVEEALARQLFPLIAKPIFGRQGQQVIKLATRDVALHYIDEFFVTRNSTDIPCYLQQFLHIVAEYRVLVLDGTVVAVTRKLPASNAVAANVAQGGKLVAVDAPEIADFAVRHVSTQGLLGVDVVLDVVGQLYILEANRAPLWYGFTQATGVDVAAMIVKRARQRIL